MTHMHYYIPGAVAGAISAVLFLTAPEWVAVVASIVAAYLTGVGSALRYKAITKR